MILNSNFTEHISQALDEKNINHALTHKLACYQKKYSNTNITMLHPVYVCLSVVIGILALSNINMFTHIISKACVALIGSVVIVYSLAILAFNTIQMNDHAYKLTQMMQDQYDMEIMLYQVMSSVSDVPQESLEKYFTMILALFKYRNQTTFLDLLPVANNILEYISNHPQMNLQQINTLTSNVSNVLESISNISTGPLNNKISDTLSQLVNTLSSITNQDNINKLYDTLDSFLSTMNSLNIDEILLTKITNLNDYLTEFSDLREIPDNLSFLNDKINHIVNILNTQLNGEYLGDLFTNQNDLVDFLEKINDNLSEINISNISKLKGSLKPLLTDYLDTINLDWLNTVLPRLSNITTSDFTQYLENNS